MNASTVAGSRLNQSPRARRIESSAHDFCRSTSTGLRQAYESVERVGAGQGQSVDKAATVDHELLLGERTHTGPEKYEKAPRDAPLWQ